MNSILTCTVRSESHAGFLSAPQHSHGRALVGTRPFLLRLLLRPFSGTFRDGSLDGCSFKLRLGNRYIEASAFVFDDSLVVAGLTLPLLRLGNRYNEGSAFGPDAFVRGGDLAFRPMGALLLRFQLSRLPSASLFRLGIL